MILPEPHATAIREALAEHRRLAERAEQAPDLEAQRQALNACWHARINAYTLITDAEREVREAALCRLERAA